MSSSDEAAFRRYDEAQALADKLRRESEKLRQDIAKEMEKLRAFVRPYHPNDPPPVDPHVDGGAGPTKPSGPTKPQD